MDERPGRSPPSSIKATRIAKGEVSGSDGVMENTTCQQEEETGDE